MIILHEKVAGFNQSRRVEEFLIVEHYHFVSWSVLAENCDCMRKV